MATQSPSGSATDNAKEQVQEKAQEAQEKVKEGAQQAQARMREQVDQRSTQAGEQVSATAQALRTTSRQLRDQGQDAQAQAAEKAAHHAERLGGYLSESSARPHPQRPRGLRPPPAAGRHRPRRRRRLRRLALPEGVEPRALPGSLRCTAPTTSVPATPATGGPAMPVAVPPPAVSGNGA